MALSYPSAQTVTISLICIAMVGAALYYNDSIRSATSQADSVQQDTVLAPAETDASTTSSSTLSSNWKKDFDSAAQSFAQTPKQGSSTPEKLTVTDQVGRDFLLSYIQLKQANLLNSTDTVNETMGNIVDAHFQQLKPRTYALTDLSVTSVPANIAALDQYSSNMTRIIETYNPSANEATLVTNYLTTGDPSGLRQLDSITRTYQSILASLVGMRVPQQVASTHLDIVNSFSALESAAIDLRVLDTDTVRGMAGSATHSDAVGTLLTSLRAMRTQLKESNIVFTVRQDILNKLIQ